MSEHNPTVAEKFQAFLDAGATEERLVRDFREHYGLDPSQVSGSMPFAEFEAKHAAMKRATSVIGAVAKPPEREYVEGIPIARGDEIATTPAELTVLRGMESGRSDEQVAAELEARRHGGVVKTVKGAVEGLTDVLTRPAPLTRPDEDLGLPRTPRTGIVPSAAPQPTSPIEQYRDRSIEPVDRPAEVTSALQEIRKEATPKPAPPFAAASKEAYDPRLHQTITGRIAADLTKDKTTPLDIGMRLAGTAAGAARLGAQVPRVVGETVGGLVGGEAGRKVGGEAGEVVADVATSVTAGIPVAIARRVFSEELTDRDAPTRLDRARIATIEDIRERDEDLGIVTGPVNDLADLGAGLAVLTANLFFPRSLPPGVSEFEFGEQLGNDFVSGAVGGSVGLVESLVTRPLATLKTRPFTTAATFWPAISGGTRLLKAGGMKVIAPRKWAAVEDFLKKELVLGVPLFDDASLAAVRRTFADGLVQRDPRASALLEAMVVDPERVAKAIAGPARALGDAIQKGVQTELPRSPISPRDSIGMQYDPIVGFVPDRNVPNRPLTGTPEFGTIDDATLVPLSEIMGDIDRTLRLDPRVGDYLQSLGDESLGGTRTTGPGSVRNLAYEAIDANWPWFRTNEAVVTSVLKDANDALFGGSASKRQLAEIRRALESPSMLAKTGDQGFLEPSGTRSLHVGDHVFDVNQSVARTINNPEVRVAVFDHGLKRLEGELRRVGMRRGIVEEQHRLLDTFMEDRVGQVERANDVAIRNERHRVNVERAERTLGRIERALADTQAELAQRQERLAAARESRTPVEQLSDNVLASEHAVARLTDDVREVTGIRDVAASRIVDPPVIEGLTSDRFAQILVGRVVRDGDLPPQALPEFPDINPVVLADQVRAAASTLFSERGLGKRSPEAIRLRRLASDLEKYERLDPKLTGLNQYVPSTVKNSIEWHVRAQQSLTQKGAFANFQSLIKASLVPRALSSIINNFASNGALQMVRRADMTTPVRLINTAVEWKRYKAGGPSAMLDAIERSGLLDTNRLAADIGKIESALDISKRWPVAKQLTGALEKAFTFGDEIYKLEEAVNNFQQARSMLADLAPGEAVDFRVSDLRTFRLVKNGDGFDVTDLHAPGRATPRRLLPDSFEMNEILGRTAAKPALDLFYDYSRTGNWPKFLRQSEVGNLSSAFFTWASKSIDIPGVKRGLVARAIETPFSPRTNSPTILAKQAVADLELAIRRSLVLNAFRADLLGKDKRMLGRMFKWMSSKNKQQVLMGTSDPYVLKSASFDGWNFTGMTELLIRVLGEGTVQAVGGPRTLDTMFPLNGLEDPGPELTRARELFGSVARGEVLIASQVLELIGLGGGPLLDILRMIEETSEPGKQLDYQRLVTNFASFIAGRTVVAGLDSAGSAFDVASGRDVGSLSTRRLEQDIRLEESALAFTIRRLTGMGWRAKDVLKQGPEGTYNFLGAAKAEWERSLNLTGRGNDFQVGRALILTGEARKDEDAVKRGVALLTRARIRRATVKVEIARMWAQLVEMGDHLGIKLPRELPPDQPHPDDLGDPTKDE